MKEKRKKNHMLSVKNQVALKSEQKRKKRAKNISKLKIYVLKMGWLAWIVVNPTQPLFAKKKKNQKQKQKQNYHRYIPIFFLWIWAS